MAGVEVGGRLTSRQMGDVEWETRFPICHLTFVICHLITGKPERQTQRSSYLLLLPSAPAVSRTLLLLIHCLLLTDAGCTENVISVRRFFARPLRVVLAASGFAAPMPLACIREASTPAA